MTCEGNWDVDSGFRDPIQHVMREYASDMRPIQHQCASSHKHKRTRCVHHATTGDAERTSTVTENRVVAAAY